MDNNELFNLDEEDLRSENSNGNSEENRSEIDEQEIDFTNVNIEEGDLGQINMGSKIFQKEEPVKVEKKNAEDKKIDPKNMDDLEYYNSLSAPSKVAYLLEKNKLKDDGFDEILSLSKEVETLSVQAGKEGATEEEKKQFAAASTELQIKMIHFLNDLQANEPQRFNTNGLIGNIIVAYNINTNVAVKAIEDVEGDIFPDLCDRSFNNTVKAAQRLSEEPKAVSKERFKKALSETIYLGKLKEEYERGSLKNKAGVLTEFFSDQFISNQENYEFRSKLYQRLIGKIDDIKEPQNLTDIAVKKWIDDTVIEMAEETYDEVYSYAELGFPNEETREKVKTKIVIELEEAKRNANNIGIKQGEDPSLKDFNNHPALDTVYLKKHIRLYGKEAGAQKNIAIELRQKMSESKEYEEMLQKTKEDAARKFDNDLKNMPKYLEKKGPAYTYIMRKAEQDEIIKNSLSIIARNEDPKCTLPAAEKKINIENAKKSFNLATMAKAEISEHLRHQAGAIEAQKEFAYYNQLLTDPKYREQKRNEAIQKAENEFKQRYPNGRIPKTFTEGSILQLVLTDERLRFERAKKTGSANEMKDIREDRYKRDSEIKAKSIELYAPQTYQGKTVYVTRSEEDAERKIAESFKNYAKESGREQDRQLQIEYERDLMNYKGAEDYYRMEIHQDKDRDDQEIRKFVQNNAEAVYVQGIDFSQVEILPEVTGIKPENLHPEVNYKYTNEQLGRMGMSTFSNEEMAEMLEERYAEMDRNRSFWGTDEYTDIKNGLRDLENLLRGDATPLGIASKARILNSKLNLYIDRKTDEKENSRNEDPTPKGRRLAAESARVIVQKIMEEQLKRANDIQRDHPFEETAADLEAVMKVTGKMGDRRLVQMMGKIKGHDYQAAITDMIEYLDANKSKYMGRDGNYTFRLREDEEGGKKRVPKKDDEKIFKTVLLNLEKLENAHLKKLSEYEPWRVPHAVFKAEHLQGAPGNKSLADYFKIKIDTDKYKDLKMDIKPSGLLSEHHTQFINRYRYYLNQASYTNEAAKLRWGDAEYNAMDAIPIKNREEMVDSALSVYYLDSRLRAGLNGEEYNAEKVEEERKQFISAVRKCGAYDAIVRKCGDYFDLNGNYNNNEALHNKNTEKREAIDTPEKFKTVIASELAKAIADKMGKAGEILADKGKLPKDTVNKYMDMVGYNLKVANVLKIDDQVRNKAQQLLNSPLKGKDFNESYQKTGQLFRDRTVIKNEPVTKEVNPDKLMMK